MICANLLSVSPSKAALATLFILVRKILTILNHCRRRIQPTPLNTESPISLYVWRIAILVENSYAGLDSFLRLIINISNLAVLIGFGKGTRIHTYCKLSQRSTCLRINALLIYGKHATLKRSGTNFIITWGLWSQESMSNKSGKNFVRLQQHAPDRPWYPGRHTHEGKSRYCQSGTKTVPIIGI